MKRRCAFLALAALVVAATSVPAFAYAHFMFYLNSGPAPAKFDLNALPNNTVWFYIAENGPATWTANDSFASLIGQIRHAAQVWNSVGSSALRVGFGGFENSGTHQNTPGADVVFDDLAPGVLGFGGPSILSTSIPLSPVTLTPAVSRAHPVAAATSATAAATAPFIPIARSAIHLNINAAAAPYPSYSEEFFLVLLHEMGHALGLQHTFTSSTMSTETTSATSLANPLDADDIAGISTLYPNGTSTPTGSIAGHVTSAGNGVHLESVVAISPGHNAVSALTNPDGSYEIDGVPQGQYYVYAHALPVDAAIAGPWSSDGSVVPAFGPTNTLFYPGTPSPGSAVPISVAPGTTATGIDIAVTSVPSLPIYDISVYGYYANNTIAVKPAYLNMSAGEAVVVATGPGLGANGQAAAGLNVAFMGGSAIVPAAGLIPYQAGGNTYLAVDVAFTPFSSAGPQHLMFSTPNFLHVLPAAIRVTQQSPPTIQSVSANADGTLTITGKNWSAGSAIYFDSVPGSVSSLSVAAGSGASGTAIVTPPPGVGAQTAILVVYNPDGQNSQFLQAANPATYTYASPAKQTIVSVSPASLPAGAEAMVDITGNGFSFVQGQTTVGFGTTDVVVRNVFVLGPNHLRADVSVAPGAALSSPDVSVINGFQLATATAAFHVTSPVNGLPAPVPALANALPGLTGSYAGAVVSLYGSNLAVANSVPAVAFNGEAAAILYSSPTQINLQIPGDIAPGIATMTLYNGVTSAYPLAVNIDTAPAVITLAQDSAGNVIGPSHPAGQGDLLTISLTGFAPDGTTIDPSRVQVGVAGVLHSARQVSQSAPGVYQVTILLSPSEPLGTAQSLIAYLDGRSSFPVTIPVATPSGSFTAVASGSSGN